MAIQHRDIPEAELHEPKGVSLAAEGTVYIATGQGTGIWDHLGSQEIKGLAGSAPADMAVVSDGSGGFKFVPHIQYGSVIMNNNSAAFSVPAASDGGLNTNTDYKILTGTGAPWAPDLTYGINPINDGLTVTTSGVYRIDVWMDIIKYPTNSSKVALKYVVNGNQFSIRKITSKANSNGDAGDLNGFGLREMNAGDNIRLSLASTEAGTVIFESANLTLTLIRAL